MTKLWFSAKRYGYGWYPASREGWLVILWYLILILVPAAMSASAQTNHPNPIFLVFYIPYVFLLTILLLWICVKKGEKARWRWGKK